MQVECDGFQYFQLSDVEFRVPQYVIGLTSGEQLPIKDSNNLELMAHSHCTGQGYGQGPENDGFLYYAMYCTHYTGTGGWRTVVFYYAHPNLELFRSRSQSRAVCMNHKSW